MQAVIKRFHCLQILGMFRKTTMRNIVHYIILQKANILMSFYNGTEIPVSLYVCYEIEGPQ